MSRFTRFSRISPHALRLEDERRAWCSAVVLAVPGLALAVVALICPAPETSAREGDSPDFIGIHIAPMGAEAEEVQVTSPLVPRVSGEAVVPELALVAEMLPHDFPEPEWEAIHTEVSESILAEHLPAELAPPTPRKLPRVQRETAPAARGADSQGELVAASYRSAPQPPYPPSLRGLRAEGRVGLRIVIDDEGVPQEVEVCSPSGYAEFDRCAREWALEHWRFHPARREGVAVASVVRTQVQFVLR